MAGAWSVGCRGDALSAFAYCLGGVALLSCALLAAKLGGGLYRLWCPDRSIPPHWVGCAAALLMLANGALLWGYFAGMETGLFTVFLLATLASLFDGHTARAAWWGGLLALTRPEGALLVAVPLVLDVLRREHREGSGRRWCWVFPALCALVQPVLNLCMTGHATANGMLAKSWLSNVPFYPDAILRSVALTMRDLWSVFVAGVRTQDLRRLPQLLLGAEAGSRLYMPPLIAGIGFGYALWRSATEWRARKPGLATVLACWVLIGLGANAVLATAQMAHYRYELPTFGLGLVIGSAALAVLASKLRRALGSRVAFALAALVLLAVSAACAPAFLDDYRQATRTVLALEVRVGEWVRENVSPGVRVGLTDAGAIRYYGDHPTYDLVGLTSTAEVALAWRHGPGSAYEAMERAPERPAFFATYEDASNLPLLVRTGLFHAALYRVQQESAARVAVSSDHVSVYQADWGLRDSGVVPYQADVLELTRGLALVDKLDVADLADEEEHRYRWWNTTRKPGLASELHELDYQVPPHRRVLDGGRLLTGGEAFDLRTIPGQDLLLVGRFLGQGTVYLTAEVNGEPTGDLVYASIPGRWQERTLRVSGRYIRSSRTHIELCAAADRPGFEFHRPYYYWAYQGQIPIARAASTHPLHAGAGDGIVLLGYDLELIQGDGPPQMRLTLYWQTDRPVQGDYTVFVHWSDDSDRILAQQDNRPVYGLEPTWLWEPGRVVVDTYQLAPATIPPRGLYTLYVGLYDARTMQRLPIAGGGPARRLALTSLFLE